MMNKNETGGTASVDCIANRKIPGTGDAEDNLDIQLFQGGGDSVGTCHDGLTHAPSIPEPTETRPRLIAPASPTS